MEDKETGASSATATDKKRDKKKKAATDDKKADSAPATPGAATEPATTAGPDGEKKKVRRRSVWVCVPTQYEEVAVTGEDGSLTAVRQATRYEITECPGGNGQKKAILAILAKNDIDPLNYGDVLMFRAEPLAFQISNQLIIRI